MEKTFDRGDYVPVPKVSYRNYTICNNGRIEDGFAVIRDELGREHAANVPKNDLKLVVEIESCNEYVERVCTVMEAWDEKLIISCK